jgi:hypothetical protein
MRLNLNLVSSLLIAALCLAAVAAVAQTALDPAAVAAAAGPMPLPKGMFALHLDDAEVPTLKGAPFCATVTTEHTQLLADGNRIHTTDDATVCRDSEGRTRREATLNLMQMGQQSSAPKLITIVDPVAGARYILDPGKKIAHRMSLAKTGDAGPPPLPPLPPAGDRVFFFRSTDENLAAGPQIAKGAGPDNDDQAHHVENLGDETINGIHATGTRMTHTIPAGKMGNEKPINVTSERWYSTDLKATVMTKHNDPWAGELKTEFTSVNASEPDSSLFTVPSDYTIAEDKAGPVSLYFPAPPPKVLGHLRSRGPV